jgi:hypothetical protein
MGDTYLELLVGRTVTGAEYNTSTVAPIDIIKNGDASFIKTSISIVVYFEEYRLSIYNNIRIWPPNKEINDFVGLKVLEAFETKEEAVLKFQHDCKVVIDLGDEAYSGPEAMYLSGPDNFWARLELNQN